MDALAIEDILFPGQGGKNYTSLSYGVICIYLCITKDKI